MRVELRENPRTFKLYVGEKCVGKIEAYDSGSCTAYYMDEECDSGDVWSYLMSYRSLRPAAKHILRVAGYGDSTEISIARLNGVQS